MNDLCVKSSIQIPSLKIVSIPSPYICFRMLLMQYAIILQFCSVMGCHSEGKITGPQQFYGCWRINNCGLDNNSPACLGIGYSAAYAFNLIFADPADYLI